MSDVLTLPPEERPVEEPTGESTANVYRWPMVIDGAFVTLVTRVRQTTGEDAEYTSEILGEMDGVASTGKADD